MNFLTNNHLIYVILTNNFHNRTKIKFKDNKNSDKCMKNINNYMIEHFYVLYFFIEDIKINVIFLFLYTNNANHI